ncbi:ATP-binding protein [Dyella caseinilytica]|uniref:ATP-binding protein n=1 Tax=Dyella caseinilytica TaxID=1849581 RepID=A0ABX7GPV4_9GAMM|nr:ATP-binding protein [Dyella caseinilytica]QRN52427.1 ATP-binding protein [Dyella caseinilytica]GGA05889.1 hypothetical protein GCM10011408_28540 [Dyella caseinilytica]
MAISLASISKTTRNSNPPRIVIHGSQKIGKSTFVAGAYNPIFLPLEDGLEGIETNSFPLLKSFEEVMEALESLKHEANDFGTVGVDSLDWLEPLVWKYTCQVNNWPDIEAPGYGKGYIAANDTWRLFFASLNDLRVNHGKAIALIAHSIVKNFASPDSEAYDRYELKLQKGALGLAVEWADVIGFATEETAIKKENAAGGKTRSRGMSTGRRVLHVNAKPAFIAGNRYNMPDTIDLSWDALMQAMTPAQKAA